MPCMFVSLSWTEYWSRVVGVVVGGGCSSGDGFQALHCSRFNWVALSVCLYECVG